MIKLTDKEYRVYLETRLRNLKRRYSKLLQHADLVDEALDTKKQIQATEEELTSMQ